MHGTYATFYVNDIYWLKNKYKSHHFRSRLNRTSNKFNLFAFHLIFVLFLLFYIIFIHTHFYYFNQYCKWRPIIKITSILWVLTQKRLQYTITFAFFIIGLQTKLHWRRSLVSTWHVLVSTINEQLFYKIKKLLYLKTDMKKSIRTNKNELRISISKVINFALYFIKYICCVRLTRRNDFINGFATI